MKLEKIHLIFCGILWGSIGLFVRWMPFSSQQIAFYRGIIACLFLLLASRITRQSIDWRGIRGNLAPLLASGVAIGVDWILLFEAYRFTTIATATICYYFTPIIVTALTPLVLKEKLRPVKLVCVITAMLGMVFITAARGQGVNDMLGIALGLGAAVLYAAVVLINKRFVTVGATERTLTQLIAATAISMPYAAVVSGLALPGATFLPLALLLILGIVHTGYCYRLYFNALSRVDAQTVVLYGYLDPLTAILLSAVVLREMLTPGQMLGGALILGATLVSELVDFRQTGNKAVAGPR